MEIVAGVDEAGRGPLAGPVVAAAVILPEKHDISGLKDSKKLSKKKREELFAIILKKAISIGIGQIDEKIIDKINIREATFKAMRVALGKLNPKPDKALIDGEQLPNQIIPNIGIVGGDNIEDSIKAASIVAKVTRDKIMEEYSIIFPEYGFERHSGYGTKQHISSLEIHKSSPIHRKSFKPVKIRMPSFKWLIEQNKINWLGKKLAALYIKNLGMKILSLDIDCLPERINIYAMDKKILVYIKVFTLHEINNLIIDESFLKYQSKVMVKNFSKLPENITKTVDIYRFDFIVVYLHKKQQPSFQYFKDIIEI